MDEAIAGLAHAASAGAEAAVGQLTELAGGRSMCAIARSGESFPAAKYHEGRWAAFTEAARQLRRGGTRLEIEQLRESWRERRDAAPTGDWRAYRSGGVDALSELSTGHTDAAAGAGAADTRTSS